ncbi:hypothetical protein C3B51_19885 [Pseudoalteromonas rubra]|uniref:Uncharacterized protein n=2 Tax=Pseudoalteromonas TaxID=53246 RepID=A0A0F4QDX6_9GAMM|nr:hypothetical protein TW77_22715 [Pseudoalteromonas rubra]RZM74336.1 hypothetical protein C3B51_19885 [Pseudoalteromonas rubra]
MVKHIKNIRFYPWYKACIVYTEISTQRLEHIMTTSDLSQTPLQSRGLIDTEAEPNLLESEDYCQEVANILTSPEQEREKTAQQFLLGYN